MIVLKWLREKFLVKYLWVDELGKYKMIKDKS